MCNLTFIPSNATRTVTVLSFPGLGVRCITVPPTLLSVTCLPCLYLLVDNYLQAGDVLWQTVVIRDLLVSEVVMP